MAHPEPLQILEEGVATWMNPHGMSQAEGKHSHSTHSLHLTGRGFLRSEALREPRAQPILSAHVYGDCELPLARSSSGQYLHVCDMGGNTERKEISSRKDMVLTQTPAME